MRTSSPLNTADRPHASSTLDSPTFCCYCLAARPFPFFFFAAPNVFASKKFTLLLSLQLRQTPPDRPTSPSIGIDTDTNLNTNTNLIPNSQIQPQIQTLLYSETWYESLIILSDTNLFKSSDTRCTRLKFFRPPRGINNINPQRPTN